MGILRSTWEGDYRPSPRQFLRQSRQKMEEQVVSEARERRNEGFITVKATPITRGHAQ